MRMGFFLENVEPNQLAWRNKDLNRQAFFNSLDTAEKMGIKYFQMYMGMHVVNADMPKEDIKLVKSILKDKDLQIVAFAPCHSHKAFYYPEENRETIDLYKREMEIAKEFGVDMFGGHLGVIMEDKNSEFYKTYYKVYKELADFAASIDSCFAIETGPDDAQTLKDFLDEIDSKGAGVNYDTANVVRILGNDAAEGIRILNKHIKLFHAKDGTCIKKSNPLAVYLHDVLGIERQGAKGYYEENAIGKGQVKWKEVIKALKEIKYDGDVIVEREAGVNTVQEILEGKALVENLLNTDY